MPERFVQLRGASVNAREKWAIHWLLGIFDTDGEVSFAGISAPTNPAFKLVLNANRAYFRLRHQYRLW